LRCPLSAQRGPTSVRLTITCYLCVDGRRARPFVRRSYRSLRSDRPCSSFGRLGCRSRFSTERSVRRVCPRSPHRRENSRGDRLEVCGVLRRGTSLSLFVHLRRAPHGQARPPDSTLTLFAAPPPTLFQYAAEDVTLSMNACSHFFHEPCLKVRSPSSCADPMPSHELQLNVPASLPLFAPLGMALFAQHLPDLPIPMQVPRFRRSRRGAYGGGGHRGHARRGRVRAALGRRLNRQGSTSSREWSSGLGVSEVAMRLSLSFLYYILFFFLARLIPRFLSVRTRYLRSVVV
jgi:hypothetical protein